MTLELQPTPTWIGGEMAFEVGDVVVFKADHKNKAKLGDEGVVERVYRRSLFSGPKYDVARDRMKIRAVPERMLVAKKKARK